MWLIALLSGNDDRHHMDLNQEEGNCSSTCVLTRHTILNLRNRNYSNGGMCCTCHTRERKGKQLMNKKQKWHHTIKNILPRDGLWKEQTPSTTGFESYSHDMKRRLRAI